MSYYDWVLQFKNPELADDVIKSKSITLSTSRESFHNCKFIKSTDKSILLELTPDGKTTSFQTWVPKSVTTVTTPDENTVFIKTENWWKIKTIKNG